MVDVLDPVFEVPGARLGELTYDELLAEGDPEFEPRYPADEWQAIALGYTRTTGRPKGVVTHRGAYLNDRRHPGLEHGPAPDLPVAHVPLQRVVLSVGGDAAGTQVRLRRVEPAAIYAAIAEHQVTHLCGAPVVMGMLINATPEQRATSTTST